MGLAAFADMRNCRRALLRGQAELDGSTKAGIRWLFGSCLGGRSGKGFFPEHHHRASSVLKAAIARSETISVYPQNE